MDPVINAPLPGPGGTVTPSGGPAYATPTPLDTALPIAPDVDDAILILRGYASGQMALTERHVTQITEPAPTVGPAHTAPIVSRAQSWVWLAAAALVVWVIFGGKGTS